MKRVAILGSTGSIGVKAELADVSSLMDKLGIRQELIASGKFKGAGSPMRPLTPEDRAYLQTMVMDLHDQFVDDNVTWSLAGGRVEDGDVGMGGVGGQWAGARPADGLAWSFLTTHMGEFDRVDLVEAALLKVLGSQA